MVVLPILVPRLVEWSEHYPWTGNRVITLTSRVTTNVLNRSNFGNRPSYEVIREVVNAMTLTNVTLPAVT